MSKHRPAARHASAAYPAPQRDNTPPPFENMTEGFALDEPEASSDFRLLFENVPGNFMVLSPAFIIVDASNAYLRATMTRREDIVGRHVFEIFPDNPDDPGPSGAAILRTSLERVVATGRPDVMPVLKYDLRRPAAEGGAFETRYWRSSNTPVHTPDGRLRYIIHRTEDFTETIGLRQRGIEQQKLTEELASERDRIERELGTMARELSQMIAALPGLVWTTTSSGITDFLSPQWQDYSGLPTGQLLGNGWLDIVHPDDRAEANANWRQAVERQGDYNQEYRLRRHDGEYRWFHARGLPLRDEAGEFLRWFGICTDIDDRKQLQKALQESDAYLRQLVESVPSMVWTSDPTGFNDYMSPQVLAYTGRSQEQLVGSGWLEVLHPEDRDQAVAVWSNAVATGTAYEVNYRIRRHDGVYRWFTARATPIVGEDGRILRWFGTTTDIDDLKQSQQALQESEENLRAAFEQAAVGMAYRSPDGHWLRVNRKYTEMLGYSDAEMQGMTYRDVSYPRELTQQVPQEEQLCRGDIGTYTIEKRYRHKAGHPVWARVTVSAIRDTKGRHLYNFVIAEDISERKRLGAELEGLFRQAAVGMVVVDTDGLIRRTNRRAAEILGYSEAELLGMHFQTITHPADRESNVDLFRRLLANEIPEYSLEKRYVRKDGNSVWTLIATSLVRESAEQPYLVTVIQDISARKRLEAELQQARAELELRVEQRTAELKAAIKALSQSEARARIVLQTATDAHVAINDKGRIVEWNRAAERMFGWTRQEALGLSITETIIPPRYRAAHEASFARFMQTGESEVMNHALELSALRRDGSEFPVELSLNANRIDDSWLISSFLRDISERKRHEADLEQATRHAEEARQKAEAARVQAEAANRAKSEFLATMSHEIRTPLNGVIGFNGLLLDGPLNEEKRHYAELARKSGESLLHLLNDFLDFSKIEAGRLQLEEMEFDPHQEIRHLMTLVQDSAQAKDIEIVLNINAPDRVRGDAPRLRQILLNLLTNAIKFTEQGRITLCCDEIVRTADHVWLCFQVSDTGIGIDAEAGKKLFQPFVQADASTTRKYGGTGLGLAISKRVAEAMGGKIGFRSRPGQGSTFWVKLPFGLMEAGAGVVHSDAAPLEITPASAEHRGRVLVVEDNPVSQLLAVEILKRLGCQADVVGNGREAVEAFRQLPYDLVFMDCDMPVMNGFDATREIRAVEAADQSAPGRHIPVIALTASAIAGDPEKCFAAGMDDFMSKPLRMQMITKMVERWLRKKTGSDAG